MEKLNSESHSTINEIENGLVVCNYELADTKKKKSEETSFSSKKKIGNNKRILYGKPYIGFKHNKRNNKNKLTPKPEKIVKSQCNYTFLQPKYNKSYLCAMFLEGDHLKLFIDF